MLGRKAHRSLAARGVIAAIGIAVALIPLPANTQQPAKIGPYTSAQATAGRATYQAKCATCHLPFDRDNGDIDDCHSCENYFCEGCGCHCQLSEEEEAEDAAHAAKQIQRVL